MGTTAGCLLTSDAGTSATLTADDKQLPGNLQDCTASIDGQVATAVPATAEAVLAGLLGVGVRACRR